MQLIEILTLLVLIQLFYSIQAGPNQKWTYDILEMSCKSSNPDWIDIKYTVERISRGKFGFSGFIHLKSDIYDDYSVGAHVEKSKFRTGPFFRLPMSVDNITLSNAMNTFYKDILMTTVQNCTVNAPYFEDEFEPPLTKRMIEMNKCDIATDNLPSVMMEGYYRMRIGFYGEHSAYVDSLVLIENK